MLTITHVQLSDIPLPKQRLKSHPTHQIEQIAASIDAFGFNDPIALDENNNIIEGMGRVLAAKQLKLKKIPVIRLEHLSDAQKQAYRIAHNKICLNTGFDLDALRDAFEELCALDNSLASLTGFGEMELQDLLRLPDVPELTQELTESMSQAKSVTCPHCGETFHA